MNRSEGQWKQQELSFDVERGLPTNKVDTSKLGSHWTVEPRVADYFTRRGNWTVNNASAVIKGELPISSVETDKRTLVNKGVTSGYNPYEQGIMDEKEVTAKDNAPIKVKSITTWGPKTESKATRQARETLKSIPSNVDYRKPGDSERAVEALGKLTRKRTRTYNPPREMKA